MQIGHHLAAWQNWYRKREQSHTVAQLLADVRQAGYTAVEITGDPDRWGTAPELRRMLDDLGLTLAAVTISVSATPHAPNEQEYRRAMDYAAELGVRVLPTCGGFFGRLFRACFEDDYKRFAENLQTAQAYANRHGQVLAYHPHCGCMVETDAELDRLLRYAPQLALCIDTGHLAAVRSDPLALIRKHADRVLHIHLKDWDPQANAFMEIGHGKAGLDFPAIFGALRASGYGGHIVVERDNPLVPPPESARLSLASLRAMGLADAADAVVVA